MEIRVMVDEDRELTDKEKDLIFEAFADDYDKPDKEILKKIDGYNNVTYNIERIALVVCCSVQALQEAATHVITLESEG